jgi:hypothetical protein
MQRGHLFRTMPRSSLRWNNCSIGAPVLNFGTWSIRGATLVELLVTKLPIDLMLSTATDRYKSSSPRPPMTESLLAWKTCWHLMQSTFGSIAKRTTNSKTM